MTGQLDLSQNEAIVVTFGNFKGGTGKTTNSTMLAYALAKKGYRVLLCDQDPQANATTLFLKTKAVREDDYITFEKTLMAAMQEGDLSSIVTEVTDNLFLLPSFSDFAQYPKFLEKRFEKEVVKWLTELDEKRFRPFGENRLYSIAQHAIKEGNKLNFEFKEEYIYFIYVMSYCGGWFHKSEIFSDIGGLFNDDIGAERLVRAKTLFPILLEKQFGSMDKLFMEYMRFPNQIEWMIAQAGGVGNIGFHHVGLFALNSAKRIGLHDYGRLKKFMELMYAQYPEKSGNENSRALYALLSMIFGKHFMHDPFYPWVSEMMKNKTTLQEGLVAVLQYAIRRSEKFARLNGDVGYA